MIKRENETYRHNIRFNGDDISLAAKMLDEISTTVEIVYYLMNRGEERAFVIMLISADETCDVGKVLQEQKRNTDILFELDKEKNIYAIICQDTKIDGGYHFAERVMKHLNEKEANAPYCVELEVRNTTYDIKYLVFKVMETYLQTKKENRSGEIVFKTLH